MIWFQVRQPPSSTFQQLTFHGADTSANRKAQIQVTSQHGEGQMLGLQDVQAIQTKLDDRIRQFEAIIEEQIKVARDLNAEIKVQNAEIKVLRDRIQEVEIELEGHNLFQYPVNTFPA